MKTPTRKLSELSHAQAHRILATFGFEPDGLSLLPVFDEAARTNLEALQCWIEYQIRHHDLALDHTLSYQLDQRISPIICYHWPERCIGLIRSA